MDFDQIKSFCTVAHLKSFRKAAEILQITQPGISRRIKSLEDELGVPLFKRTPQSVSLTQEGTQFLPYAERILKVMDEGTKKALDSSEENSLTIAASSSTSFNLLPKIIKEFKQNFDIYVTIYTVPSARVFDMLLDQTIDLGFTTSIFPNPLITYEKVFEEEIICVGKPDIVKQYMEDNLIKKYPIPIICNTSKTPPWSVINDYMLDSSSFKIIIRSDYPQLIRRLVEQGIGMAFLPLSDTVDALNTGELIKIPITIPDLTSPSRPVYLLTYKDSQMKNAALQFKHTLKNCLSNSSYL